MLIPNPNCIPEMIYLGIYLFKTSTNLVTARKITVRLVRIPAVKISFFVRP